MHCDVLNISTVIVAILVLDCNGVFAIKAYAIYVAYAQMPGCPLCSINVVLTIYYINGIATLIILCVDFL